jgi:ubiquitin-associated SH3 domain-containing protein
VDGLTADTSSPSQASSLPWFPGASAASRAQSQGALHQASGDAVRQNIYENFMRELGETGVWQLVDPPILPLTHGPNHSFNWREMLLQD